MIILLRGFFLLVLVVMVSATIWASSEVALWNIPNSVGAHPWFLATLLDAYLGFLTFYIWVAYRETSWRNRIGWLIGILLFGNIAMAIYALIQLYKVDEDASLDEVLLRRTKK